MVTEIREFKSVNELIDHINHEINNITVTIESYMKKINEIKDKIEKLNKISDYLTKVLGKRPETISPQEVNFMGLKIIINPSLKQELEVFEDIIKKLNDKLIALQKIRKAIESLGLSEYEELELKVVIIDELPVKLMIKLE